MISRVGDQQATDGSRRSAARVRRGAVGIWPSSSPAAYARRRPQRLPFPLGDDRAALFSRCRDALAAGLRSLALEPGAEVLAPALLDPWVIDCLLSAGLAPRFADGAPFPEPAAFEALAGEHTRALLLSHTLGAPQDGAQWRKWCDERGLLLIEDASRAWQAACAGDPAGSSGAIAVVGLPSAAALVVQEPHESPPDARLPAGRAALLERLAADDAAAGRRGSWAVLQQALGDELAQAFAPLAPGAAPFCFPVRTADKAALIARCAERGVQALDVWPEAHPAVSGEQHPVAAALRATTVGLPVHNELAIGDLDRVIEAAAPAPPRSRPAAPRIERIERLEDAAEDFDRLAEEGRNLFATWDWMAAWWRHFGGGRELATFAVRDAAGRTIGLLPAYVASRRPVPTLRFIGHGPFDWLGPVCAARDVPQVARALDRALRDGTLGADLLVGEQLAAEQRWGALLGGSVVARDASPVLSFSGDFEAWLASRSRNFRDQVRRRERKLARAHTLEYRLCTSEEDLDRDLDTLLRLHGARWEGDGDETSFTTDDRAFHREVALAALRRGRLRLWTLDLDGRPAASWLGYRFAGTEWYYQSGRDPELESGSVGFVLLAHTVRTALDDGISQYRLLRGGEEYKSRFANGDPGLETVVAAGSRSARVAAAVAVAASAAPPRARRWVRELAA